MLFNRNLASGFAVVGAPAVLLLAFGIDYWLDALVVPAYLLYEVNEYAFYRVALFGNFLLAGSILSLAWLVFTRPMHNGIVGAILFGSGMLAFVVRPTLYWWGVGFLTPVGIAEWGSSILPFSRLVYSSAFIVVLGLITLARAIRQRSHITKGVDQGRMIKSS